MSECREKRARDIYLLVRLRKYVQRKRSLVSLLAQVLKGREEEDQLFASG